MSNRLLLTRVEGMAFADTETRSIYQLLVFSTLLGKHPFDLIIQVHKSVRGRCALNILIIDRNKRVGKYLKRELEKDHHFISLANSGRGLLDQIRKDDSIDLLIFDPDLPDIEISSVVETLTGMGRNIGIIILSYSKDSPDLRGLPIFARLEKNANSVDVLRAHVFKYSQEFNRSTTEKTFSKCC